MTDIGNISKNMSCLKGIAALTVMLGHYSHIPNFWVVVTMCLLVFSISSGYFTHNRYHNTFSWMEFWKRKAIRLAPRLLFINTLLICIFFFQDKPGLWSMHTFINLIGMNGILNWLKIHNASPLGAGMWFFTLLIVFYCTYPIIEKCYKGKYVSFFFTVTVIILLYVCQANTYYSHALWLTAAGFFIGIYISHNKFSVSRWFLFSVMSVILIIMLIFHFFLQIDNINYFFILSIPSLFILILKTIVLPQTIVKIGAWFSSMLLEIYLLHPYLQITPTSYSVVNIYSSIILVIFVSFCLVNFLNYILGTGRK